MNESILLIFAILISAGLGLYLGLTIARLKNKGDKSTLEERQKQLSYTINDLKENLRNID